MPPLHITVYDAPDEDVLCNKPCKISKSVGIQLENNTVHPIWHVKDMSAADRSNLWYGRQYIHRVEDSIVPILRKINNGVDVPESDFETTRGLEVYTQDVGMYRHEHKLHYREAVLQEYNRQRSVGIQDNERLAEVSLDLSRVSTEDALELAIEDEEFANLHLESVGEELYAEQQANRLAVRICSWFHGLGVYPRLKPRQLSL